MGPHRAGARSSSPPRFARARNRAPPRPRRSRSLILALALVAHAPRGRRAQVCALAQLLLEPHYRTIEGFATLVEKDWCAFGHQFALRCGHGTAAHADQRAPIFLQWLDVVWQLSQQFPTAFEFTTSLLLFLADALHSCCFGTFLGDSERERRLELEAPAACKSVWTYVLAHRRAYESRVYHHHAAALWPVASVKRVRLWEQYYCRWDSEFHPHGPSAAAWIPDFGNLAVTATARAKNKYANAVAAATTSFMAGEAVDDDDEDDDSTDDEDPWASAAAERGPAS